MKVKRLLHSFAAVTILVAAGLLIQANKQQAGNVSAGLAAQARPLSIGASQATPSKAAASSEDNQNIARVTSLLLTQNHYSRQPVNDAVSSRLLDLFIETLDPQHAFFLQSDIAEFEPLRTKLDDLTGKQGDTSPARQIFDRFLERFDAQTAFVESALKSESFTFTGNETFVTDREKLPRPKDMDEAKRLWRDRLRYEYLQEKLNNAKPEEIVTNIAKRYARLARTLHEYDSDDIFELYLSTLTRAYDPHSGYFGKASSENFDIQMTLSLFGIGAVLGSEDGYTKIESLTPGGPAIKSKQIKPGDRIVEVAQGQNAEPVNVVEMKLPKVVEMIRGPKGTPVRLTILPADAPDPSTRKTVVLIRDEIKLEEQAAKASLIELPDAKGKSLRLGVIDLPSFYEDPVKKRSATADVARLLGKLKREKVAGVILDLRRNGGGSLPEAIALTGLFIKQGPVVQVRDPDGEVRVDRDTNPAVAYDGPLVVLTSRMSASASEIVAGALQDYGRALIVGDSSSFGKGTVQAVVGLAPIMQRAGLTTTSDPGSLHLTIQKFYRASGSSTQLKGVTPDLVLPSLNQVLDTGEQSLKNPLPWDTIPPARYTKLNRVQSLLPELKRRSQARVASDKDFTFLRAQIGRLKTAMAQKSVSLNEAQRRKEKQEAEARAAARKKELAARPPSKERVFALTLKDVNTPGLPKPQPVQKGAVKAAVSNPTTPPRRSDTPTSGDETDADAATDKDITMDEAKRILTDLIALSR